MQYTIDGDCSVNRGLLRSFVSMALDPRFEKEVFTVRSKH